MHGALPIALIAFVVAVLVMLAIRSAWRTRRVDFVHQVSFGPDSGDPVAELFDRTIPVLARAGYAMVAQGGNTTVFERRFFPGWTIFVAVFVFPIGLLALLARGQETIVIVRGDRTVDLHGYSNKEVADFLVQVAENVADPAAYSL